MMIMVTIVMIILGNWDDEDCDDDVSDDWDDDDCDDDNSND